MKYNYRQRKYWMCYACHLLTAAFQKNWHWIMTPSLPSETEHLTSVWWYVLPCVHYVKTVDVMGLQRGWSKPWKTFWKQQRKTQIPTTKNWTGSCWIGGHHILQLEFHPLICSWSSLFALVWTHTRPSVDDKVTAQQGQQKRHHDSWAQEHEMDAGQEFTARNFQDGPK